MGGGWPFVGRREELLLIARALRDRDVGGLVLAGPAGVGKTRLALEALGQADPGRCVARRVVATRATRAISFGALAQLLPAELPFASDRVNLLRLAGQALVSGIGPRRLVLAVDDAHLLDDLSAALLHQLVRTGAAFALIVVRNGEPAPEPVTELWRNNLVERLDLGTLPQSDVAQALAEHLGAPFEGMTMARLWSVSAGNVLLLREVVNAGREAGVLRRIEGLWCWRGPWVLSARLDELIDQRLNQLRAVERHVLELLAWSDPLELDILGRFVPVEAIEAVEARSLCRIERSGFRVLVRLIHPFHGEALRARTPVLRARRWQRQLADALEQTGARRADDPLRLAGWRLASGMPTSPDELMTAARRALVRSDFELADRMAAAAYQGGADLDAAQVVWEALMLQGRSDGAERFLAKLADLAVSDRDHAWLATAEVYLCGAVDGFETRLALIETVLSGLADPLARAELRALQAILYAHAGQLEQATRLAGELRQLEPIETIRGHAHFVDALTSLLRGRSSEAVADFDRAIATPGWTARARWLGELAHAWRAQAQLCDGRLVDAATTAETSYRRGLATDSPIVIGLACVGCGQVCRARGQLRRSVRWLREGIAAARSDRQLFPQLLGELAHSVALLGDHGEAERALAEADGSRRHGLATYHLWLDLARIWVITAGGDRAAATRVALRVADAAHAAGATSYEAIALHDAARLGAAATVADRLRALTSTTTGSLVECYAAHASALVAGDGSALEQVSLRLERIGALLLAAEAAAEASRAYRSVGRADSARRSAARATALAAQCEGARTPALHALQAPELTPRQGEIVELAAAGLTNDEIAHRLDVSIRTVHNHLHLAYAKLGVHRRTELSFVLQRPHRVEA